MLKRHKPMGRGKAMKSHAPGERDRHADACRKLSAVLADNEVAGLQFREHERLGLFFADFYCAAARLVLQLTNEGQDADSAVLWWRDNGYRVLEFPVGEVLDHPEFVLDAIAQSFELRIVPPKS